MSHRGGRCADIRVPRANGPLAKDRFRLDTNSVGMTKHLSRAERRRRIREGAPAPAADSAPAPPRPAPATVQQRARVRRSRRPLWIWWVVGAAALAAVTGGTWWALSSRTVAQGGPKIDGERVPNEGSTHVPLASEITYRAHPPASGNHYDRPAPRGVYPEGLLEGFWVHSLEHGYVVLAYRPPVSLDQLQVFDQMVKTFPNSKYGYAKLVIVPYKEMDHPYAVLAWTWRLWLDQFDRTKILAFYRAHVDRGPEDIP